MSKYSSRGQEPYTVRHLRRWIEHTYRPVVLPQSDNVFVAYRLSDDRTVVVPGPSADGHPVANGTARKIAAQIGLEFEEFRSALGHPIVRHSRPVRKPLAAERKSCTKSDVTAAAKALHRAVNDIEHAIKSGDRDPAFYMRLHERLTAALAETQAAFRTTQQRGAA